MTSYEQNNNNYPPAIRQETLINKVSFVVTGASAEDGNILKLLIKYLNYRGDKIISRQAINGWINRGAIPKRRNGFYFLDDFLKQNVTLVELSTDQKKVYKQLRAYFRRKLAPKVSSSSNFQPNLKATYIASQHGFMINNLASASVTEESFASWIGWYISYRYRLLATKTTINPIAVEAVQIKKQNNALHFSHWHRKDGGQIITKFDGGVLINPDSVWMIGLEEPDSRLRICHFKNVRSSNQELTRVRWGLMHSDMPATASREPASTRIAFFRHENDVNNVESFIKNNVRYCSLQETPKALQGYIKRMLPNNVCAASNDGGISPVDSDDMILKVDERTSQSINSMMARKN